MNVGTFKDSAEYWQEVCQAAGVRQKRKKSASKGCESNTQRRYWNLCVFSTEVVIKFRFTGELHKHQAIMGAVVDLIAQGNLEQSK